MGTRIALRASLLTLAATAVAVVAPLGAAQAKTYDLPAIAAKQITKIDARSSVPVLLPDHLAIDYPGKLFVSGGTSDSGWHLEFDGAPDCGGATACFLASVTAETGGRPGFKRTVKLAGGVTGYYKPLTCGGSCSPPVIQFVRGGVLYEIAAKVPGKALKRLTTAANEALAAGPRT
jgi:hypothetical protein